MADKNNSQPDVNEQIKVRMDKLAALQEAGKDPFQITKYDVTHHTDEIRAIYEAHEKELLGDRPAVNTDGMDEQQAREAVNADYNDRRAIMDASPIEVSFAGRMMRPFRFALVSSGKSNQFSLFIPYRKDNTTTQVRIRGR